jgi:hypothetical protein
MRVIVALATTEFTPSLARLVAVRHPARGLKPPAKFKRRYASKNDWTPPSERRTDLANATPPS